MTSRKLVSHILLAVLAVAAWGCSSAPPPAPPAPVRVYPTPPDSPRIQFFARISSSFDVEKVNEPGFFDRLIGEEETVEGESISKPYGIGAHDGKLYVCDTMLPGIVVLDLENQSFDSWKPNGGGTLQKPINCTTDPADGRLFVADTERGEVVVFGSDRQFIGSFAGGDEARPTDVFVDDSLAWVADFGRGTLTGYDRRTFEEVRRVPSRESADSAAVLTGPLGVWATPDAVYVSEFGQMRVAVYDRAGRYLRSVGSYGRALGQFARPRGIAVDREGLLYVVDASFSNVQVFDDQGQLLMFFGGPYEQPGDMYLPAQVSIDYGSVDLFADRVIPGYRLAYMIYVTNQYGPDKVNVYGRIVPVAGAE